jgi:hypothetical protein
MTRACLSFSKAALFYTEKRAIALAIFVRHQGVLKWLTLLFTPSLLPLASIESTV